MRIIIAPNAFKGSLSAGEAARCIAKGLKKSQLLSSLQLIPIADGGDGTAHLISKKLSARPIKVLVHGPLGRKTEASYGWLSKSNTAIIELADASGLRLLNHAKLNPLKSNTRGTGELIKSALDKGAKKIMLCIGGSATVDGATGLLDELGVKFLDKQGNKIKELPNGLLALNHVDVSLIDRRMKDCEITVLCDVSNKLLGANGAASVFGPQKGANEKEVALLERCLYQLNKIVKKDLGIEMDSFEYGGSAGGVAAGLAAFLNAKLVSGISFYLDIIGFENELKNTNLLITAEGKFDSQTMEGKGPFGVADKASKYHIPVILLAGQVPPKITNDLHRYFNVMMPIAHAPASLNEAMKNTAADLERTAMEFGNLLALKINELDK